MPAKSSARTKPQKNKSPRISQSVRAVTRVPARTVRVLFHRGVNVVRFSPSGKTTVRKEKRNPKNHR